MQQRGLLSNGPWSIAVTALVLGGTAVLAHELAGLRLSLTWVGCAAAASWVAASRSQRARREELKELSGALTALARGEFGRRVAPTRLGDFAATAAALNRVIDVLTRTQKRMTPLIGSLTALPAQVSEALGHMRNSAESQEAAVEETASLHASLDASIHSIQDEVANLAAANEESAASILELGSCSNQVARAAAALHETLTSSTTALELLGDSVQGAAGNANSVELVAEETAAAAAQMGQTARDVATHVKGASELTSGVAQRADEGSAAMRATIDGMHEIRAATVASREALAGLAGGIDEIGEIATVIRSITNETNLLSLNASIIASQAGEHGRAFAVVADQVKELARRTGQNTEQIDGLIRAVQERSSVASRAMSGGMQAVDRGVVRSRAAGEALEHIRSAARDASSRVADIAYASEEQGRSSQDVAEAARRTSDHVQEITGALAEQAISAERLLENAGTSVQMCQQMASAAEQQRAACLDIAANGESISDRIKSIQCATADHELTRQDAMRTLESLIAIGREGAAQLPELGYAVETLRSHGQELANAMTRFDETGRKPQSTESPR